MSPTERGMGHARHRSGWAEPATVIRFDRSTIATRAASRFSPPLRSKRPGSLHLREEMGVRRGTAAASLYRPATTACSSSRRRSLRGCDKCRQVESCGILVAALRWIFRTSVRAASVGRSTKDFVHRPCARVRGSASMSLEGRPRRPCLALGHPVGGCRVAARFALSLRSVGDTPFSISSTRGRRAPWLGHVQRSRRFLSVSPRNLLYRARIQG